MSEEDLEVIEDLEWINSIARHQYFGFAEVMFNHGQQAILNLETVDEGRRGGA